MTARTPISPYTITLSILLCCGFFLWMSAVYAQSAPAAQSCEEQFKDDAKAIAACKSIQQDSTSTGDANAIIGGLVDARESIYGCNGISKYGPVGQQHARGTYVPVSEEAVALNTFILVNKVCVLDALARTNRNAFATALVRAQMNAINSGRDDGSGRPQYVQDLGRFDDEIRARTMVRLLRNTDMQRICSPMRDTLLRGAARTFLKNQTDPAHRFACTFKDQAKLRALYKEGRIDIVGWDGFQQSLEENNNPFLARLALDDYLTATVSNELSRAHEELQFGSGFLPKKKCEQVPVGNGQFETQCNTVTPGAVVAQSAGYLALTGNRLVESADEINKMVGTLFGNLASQILSSNTGLTGATQSQGDQPSYLDQAVSGTFKDAQTQTLTTGVDALQKALEHETAYVAARTTSKKVLEDTKTKLTTLQNSCMATLGAQAKADIRAQLQAEECGVQVNPLANTCSVTITVTETDVAGVRVIDARGPTKRKVVAIKAPGKAESVITSSVQPMLDSIVAAVTKGQNALKLLNQLAAQVQSATAPEVVAAVVANLNKLIEAKVLHDESALISAKDQHSRIVDAMQSLVDRTKDDWEGDWCQASKWQALIVPTPTTYQ